MKYYQVQIRVPHDLCQDFLVWLEPHIEDMVKLPTFTHAQLARLIPGKEGWDCFQVQYYYEEDQDFQDYIDKFAAQMRRDLPAEWQDKLHFERGLGSVEQL